MNTELVSSLVSSDLSVSVSPVADSAPASRSTLLARRMILLRSRYARKLYHAAQSARSAGRIDYAAFTMRQAARLYASVKHAQDTVNHSISTFA